MTRDSYRIVRFRFANLPGWPTGKPLRGCLHTDGNPRPHTALGALTWGNRVRAFSIHHYIEDDVDYQCIPEDWHASHVKESRKAAALGYPVNWPGLAARGDLRTVGFEHVQDAAAAWSPDTRLTSVLVGADVLRRHGPIPFHEHADLDPWTRAFDVGQALHVGDWRRDVDDVLAGLEPFRVVGPTASGARHQGERPPPLVDLDTVDPAPRPAAPPSDDTWSWRLFGFDVAEVNRQLDAHRDRANVSGGGIDELLRELRDAGATVTRVETALRGQL